MEKYFFATANRLWLFFMLFFSQVSFAQGTLSDDATWLTYFGQFRLSAKWGIHLDAQFRADGELGRVNQNLLRTGLQYYLGKKANLTFGYAHIATYSGAIDKYVPEARFWQQLIVLHQLGPAQMTHRLRFEERLIRKYAPDAAGDLQADGNNYGSRLRYFHRSIFHLSREKNNVPYLALQEEIFFNIAAEKINPNFFDQNRFLLALGIFHQQHTRLEIGYLNQFIHPRSGPFLMNHVLHLSILQSLNFSS